ncbi:MAG: cyclic nucleotide-binding domain-containing protein [Legionellaceae bacterium]|nr:cyclic nucleotide-binding domain-containing protein [Legionellaceae bacterium]
MVDSKVSFLASCKLFTGVSRSQLEAIAPFLKEVTVVPGDVLIQEHQQLNDVYIIKEGLLKVTRVDADSKLSHEMMTLGGGDVVGEMALIDGGPRSASVTAETDGLLYCLKKSDLLAVSNQEVVDSENALYALVSANIAKIAIQKVRVSNDIIVSTLAEKLELTKARLSGSFLILNTVILIAVYIIALQLSNYYSEALTSHITYFSQTLALIFGIGVVVIIKNSQYPYAFYGITLNNWKRSITESLLLTVVLMGGVVFYKWLVSAGDFGLFSPLNAQSNIEASIWTQVVYLLFVPVQELVARGILQSMFTELLVSKHRVLLAIILSNILFAITHMHISASFAAIVLVPGLAWGWLYARHRTLIGVMISHLILGFWTLHVLNVF